MDGVVIDSSVVVGFARGEADCIPLFERALRAERRLMSAVNWLEAAMVCDGGRIDGGSELFDALLQQLAVEIVPMTETHAHLARAAFRSFGRGTGSGGKLNFGDCFAYALAKSLDLPLLFKGDDFSSSDVRRAV